MEIILGSVSFRGQIGIQLRIGDHFGGCTDWQCEGGMSLVISNQETRYLVTLVPEKFYPGESLAWHSPGFEVKEA